MVWSWSTIMSVVVRKCSIADTRSGSMSAIVAKALVASFKVSHVVGEIVVDVGDDARRPARGMP